MRHKTSYYGIWIEEDRGYYYIVDDNGNEQPMDQTYPVEQDVEDFRDQVCNY